jgi:hypothetical protein
VVRWIGLCDASRSSRKRGIEKGGGSEVEKDLKELGRKENAGKIWGWEEWR